MMPPLKTILYVEDEPDIRTIAQMALESLGGFKVELCGSGEEAVDRAPNFAPELILLDVMMPGMDGPATFRALRALPGTAETPVIFMTAKTQTHEVAALIELGAIGVIPKPFDPIALADQINALWETTH